MKKMLSHECMYLPASHPIDQFAGHTAKFYLSLILFLLMFFKAFSSAPDHAIAPPVQPQQDWQLDITINGVSFYHSISTCNGKSVVFLRFVNNNNYQVSISWKEVFATQAGDNVEGFRGKQSLVLSVGETSETNCTNPRNKECVILSSQIAPTYPAEVSAFRFKDITINKI